MLVHPSLTQTPCAGLVVSKKVGKAVRRNLIKRRLRAYLRKHEELASLSRDVIIIARPGCAEISWRELCEELDSLFARAGQMSRRAGAASAVTKNGDSATL